MCEPPVTVNIKTDILVGNKPVTVIEVPEGSNKPYLLRGKTAYIRRGASDFPISRTELDRIYQSRGQGVTLPPHWSMGR